MTPEDQNELKERRLTEKTYKAVKEALVTEFRWLAILVAFLTGGGVVLITNNLLSESKQKLAVSEALHERNLKSLDKIDTSLLKIEKFSKTMESLESRLNSITASASEVQRAITQAQRQNLEISDELRKAVVALGSELEKDINLDSSTTVDAIKDIVGSLSDTGDKIAESERRIDLSQYAVYVANFEGASELAESLSEEGYLTRVFDQPVQKDVSSRLSIGIGRDIPVSAAAELVRIAKETFPFLRYVNLVNQPGDEGWPSTAFFIGGTTKRSIDHGYRPLTDEEFQSLFDDQLSKEEYHNLISSFIE